MAITFLYLVLSWSVPEEFRLWKEKIEAVEKKKNSGQSLSVKVEPPSSTNVEAVSGATISSDIKVKDDKVRPVITSYASVAEAHEAFMDLLTMFKVSTSAKWKEVQDMCQTDPRWDALKSQGEKKQCLAEFQVYRFLKVLSLS